MNILLVEDSATLRFVLEAQIRDAGHTPLIAENGEKAVQIVDIEPIDMILMDVEMPGLNGFETTRLIRENLQDNWIPIIFVTGKSDELSLEEGIRVGGDDYLIKPVSNVILQAKIKAMERIANMRRQLHKLNAELVQISQYDGLTELLNRRSFDERAANTWRLSSRLKQPLGVILFDIDHFKKYNDTYGHQAGDECIKKVAAIAKDCCHRPGDIVARYGGEEFVVLLPDTDLNGAKHIAECLRSKTEQENIEHSGASQFGKVTISVGACVIKYTTGASLEELIAAADKALYRCKHKGRNTVQVDEFKNLHKVLLIDYSGTQRDQLSTLLDGHCQLSVIDSDNGLGGIGTRIKPELVILSAEHGEDTSIDALLNAKQRAQLDGVPILLMSSMNEDELKSTSELLAASGSISTPFDSHQTIAKIDQLIATH